MCLLCQHMDLPLSKDVWVHIRSFLRCDSALRAVCRSLHEHMGPQWYLRFMPCRSDQLLHRLHVLGSTALMVKVRRVIASQQVSKEWLQYLVKKLSPKLQTLKLNLAGIAKGLDYGQQLANLHAKDILCTMKLDLSSTSMVNAHAESLADVCVSRPALHTLSLGLNDNCLSRTGMQALAKLRNMPSLENLSLRVSTKHVEDAGAVALAQLKEAPKLRVVHLELRRASLKSGGAQALAELWRASDLESLDIDLAHNKIDDVGAQWCVRQEEGESFFQTKYGGVGHEWYCH